MTGPKRLIEVDLPIGAISRHARREKSLRHGHISTLHIWWARRPLAACRAALIASLIPDPADAACPSEFLQVADAELLRWRPPGRGHAMRRRKPIEVRKALLDFIAEFANWDASNDPDFLRVAHALVESAHRTRGHSSGRPLVLEPFAGGGAIPLEAARLGTEVFASDLNAIPVLLNKVVLEWLPRYGNSLAEDLRKWGAWILSEARAEMAGAYPTGETGAEPIAFFWARTMVCPGPACGLEYPLLRTTTLTTKNPATYVTVHPQPNGRTQLRLHEGRNPKKAGTIFWGKATCPSCGYSVPEQQVKTQFVPRAGGAASAQLYAVLWQAGSHRTFREPTAADVAAFEASVEWLRSQDASDPDRLPNELINPKRPYKNTVGVCIVTRIGIQRFRDLYNPRQLRVLVVLQDLVRRVRAEMGGEDDVYRDVIATLLHLVLNRIVFQNSSISRWHTSGAKIEGMFSKQALQIVWDFVESNPLGPGSANWEGALDWVVKFLDRNAGIRAVGSAMLADARSTPLPEDSVDLLFTDPPYFAAVPYADLSDVFYVWLRRGLGDVHPDLFKQSLAPKEGELVVTNSAVGRGGVAKDERYFYEGMRDSLAHARVLAKPDAVGVVVFADTSTTSWEAMLGALIDGGWILTASWPIDTEMQNRTRAHRSASLQSSVFMVCRPRELGDGTFDSTSVGDWRDVLTELPRRIHAWMPRLAQEGVVGADAIFACLGPALEIYSQYARVEDTDGTVIDLPRYLEKVWEAVGKEALDQIFQGGDATGFESDARLTAMWLWTLSTGPVGAEEGEADDEDDDDNDGGDKPTSGFALAYDAARKIAQGLGAHLRELTTLVEVDGQVACLLAVADRATFLFGKVEVQPAVGKAGKKPVNSQMKLGFVEAIDQAESERTWGEIGAPTNGRSTLDRVHQAMLLFGANRGEALRRFLVEDGAGADERFWRLAQALNQLYPPKTDERRWVEGVLARKKLLGF